MSNPDSTIEVIQAIQDALLADSTINTLVGQRVFDRVPDVSDMPLIAIGDVVGNVSLETADLDEDGETEDGFEIFLSLEVWSKTRSRKQAALIMLAMSNRLRRELTLATKRLVLIELNQQRINPIEGDQYAYGFQRWRILTN